MEKTILRLLGFELEEVHASMDEWTLKQQQQHSFFYIKNLYPTKNDSDSDTFCILLQSKYTSDLFFFERRSVYKLKEENKTNLL